MTLPTSEYESDAGHIAPSQRRSGHNMVTHERWN
jgi:hypothetical protein